MFGGFKWNNTSFVSQVTLLLLAARPSFNYKKIRFSAKNYKFDTFNQNRQEREVNGDKKLPCERYDSACMEIRGYLF